MDNSGTPPTAQPAARRGQLRWYVLGGLLMLLIGAVSGSWAVDRLREWRGGAPVASAVAVDTSGGGNIAPDTSAPQPMPLRGTQVPLAPTDVAGRLRLLEAQVAELSATAGSMSGNAARAEALLIAFAARRALDRGLALGSLESQLRLRFGDAQPNAVRTVIDVARTPVTLDWLQTEYDKLAPSLAGETPEASLWSGLRREMRDLFVLRDAAAPSTRDDQRVIRARRLLDAGLVDAAIREVSALPSAPLAAAWVTEARRYHEARRALDLIETAAILAPKESAPLPTPLRR